MIRLNTNTAAVIAQLREYRNSIQARMDEVIRQLVAQGEVIARAEIVEMDASGGTSLHETASGISRKASRADRSCGGLRSFLKVK